MVGESESPLVSPLPPDLLFLLPLEATVPLASPPLVEKDTIMTEAVSVSDKIDVSPATAGVPPILVALSSGTSVTETVQVKNLANPTVSQSDYQAGPSSTPSSAGVPKGSTSQGSEFNWLSRTKAARKFPNSSIPVTRFEEGVPRVKIPNVVFERGAKAHSDYIVGIFYGNAPSYGKIWGVLNYLWGKDRRRILQHELWRIGDSPFFVTEWKASFSIDPPSLQQAPIWATLNKVPFDLLTDEGLEIISKPLGRIVDAKPFSSVSSVDVKVVVDLTVKLPTSVEIERENGLVDVLEVSYAWLPPLCPKTASKAADRSRPSTSNKQYAQKVHPQDQTIPVQSCINSVLADLEPSSGTTLVGGTSKTSCSVSQSPEVFPIPPPQDSMVEAPSQAGLVSLTEAPCQGSLQLFTASNDTLPVPDSIISHSELPFVPAMKAVLVRSVVGSSQEKLVVISFNPFAVLEQEEDPPNIHQEVSCQVEEIPRTCLEESKLTLVVTTPGSSKSPPSQFLSKTQKYKKRKLAKRSPGPIKVQFLFADSQSITVKILPPESLPFYFTAVYASNDLDERRQLWISLKDTAIAFDLSTHPWMVCGDFNEILDPRESSNPSIISSTRAMREFASCLSDIGIFDLASQGPKFTWSNHRPSDPIGKRIDRCLVNDLWQLSYPKGFCSFEPPEFSDHTPCHIRLTSTKPDFGTRSFMFPSYLTKLPSFVPTIKECWSQLGAPAGNLTYLCFKLKQLKSPIKSLCKENFSQIERRVQEAKSTLDSHQLQALNLPSQDNIALEKQSRETWLFLCLAEEMFFRQKSCIKWLEVGDLNTCFFHRITLVRNALIGITYLLRGDGSRSHSLKEVHQIAASHFAGILCTLRGSHCLFLPEVLSRIISAGCSPDHQAHLSVPVSATLIKTTLFKLSLNRTPGSDGLTAEFFRSTWSFLGDEVCMAILDFFRTKFMPSCFIKNRLLLENVLLASEVLNGYHKKNRSPRITLKIDISKAFDSVRWDFLLQTLKVMQFPSDFVDCIRAYITTPSFSLSINGVTSGFFKGKSGLRQGDPISPLLFTVVMNVLSFMLNRGAEDRIFGYHPGCAGTRLTHLAFADDLLIFLDGTETSLAGVFTVLSQFEKFSGLQVNMSKTSMFSSGLAAHSQDNILNRFRLRSLQLPVRYLGLPLCSKKLSVRDCDPLLSQIRRKLNGWMNRHLSMAGRLQFISSTIPGILGFWSSAFSIPKKVLKMIQSLLSSFLWHGTLDNASAKVAWDSLCYPKCEGGLGIRGLSSWNTVFGIKLIWMLYFRAGSIWVAWVRDKYLSAGSFWSLNSRSYSISWTFRRLLKLRHIALSFLSISVREGGETYFWFDPWTPYGILIDYLGPSGPMDLGIPLNSLVSSITQGSAWILRPARSERQLNLHVYLTSFSPSPGSDAAIWKVGDRICTKFSTKDVWKSIRMAKPSVSWARFIWNQAIIPKYRITSWLFTLNRNPTMDRMIS
ncbi:uncharacterized protein LOC106394243 [Brassica napus]|uniref:uncharacterized protein LOC106394243 n=1 Tax=Brassica napus TaxID=3708 RepID=UPI002078D4F2|nr:uncharacterized protein LOC106394243 [Brassica napus]